MDGGLAVTTLGAGRGGRGVPLGALRRDGLDRGAGGGGADESRALQGLKALVGRSLGLVGGAPVPDGAIPGVPVLLVGGDGGLLGLEGSVVEALGRHCDFWCCGGDLFVKRGRLSGDWIDGERMSGDEEGVWP